MSDKKEHGVVEMLTWADGTVMARWRPDVGDHETIAADTNPTVVKQELYRWSAQMKRAGWHQAGRDGGITHFERRPPKRHAANQIAATVS